MAETLAAGGRKRDWEGDEGADTGPAWLLGESRNGWMSWARISGTEPPGTSRRQETWLPQERRTRMAGGTGVSWLSA